MFLKLRHQIIWVRANSKGSNGKFVCCLIKTDGDVEEDDDPSDFTMPESKKPKIK